MRRHGWQRPLHSLQIVGISIYCFLVVTFYSFLGLFLGNRVAEITLSSVFSFVALSVMILFIRCTAINPTDKTSFNKKRKNKPKGITKLNYGYIFGQIIVRFFKRVERKILRSCIRRKYLDPLKTSAQMEPLLPFPLVIKDDAVSPHRSEDDISFCALCDFEVKRHSKHCRTCNRCVEGFDHHCRWLNNCVGKKNYTTFILLMIFTLLMLVIEGGCAIAIFIRCFADKKGIEKELQKKLYIEFPREILATISVLLVLLTAYGSAALGQLFLFHIVLIRKGMRTYDYILAMKEENRSMELNSFTDSDFSSDESTDTDSPRSSTLVSRFICRGHKLNPKPARLSIRIDGGGGDVAAATSEKKPSFHASIDPFKLIRMSKEKALTAADKARKRLINQQKPMVEEEQRDDSLKPLPLETKIGPSLVGPIPDKINTSVGSGMTPLISKSIGGGPRRRISSSPTTLSGLMLASSSPKQQKYRTNFDLKLTEVSRELETYISRQVLCSVLKKDVTEASPR